ncbi:MAG: hypothetical protein OXT70_12480 [Chloroflexota bacterium]|nr:hypothetical protein [Chloroflexota bacterium]
MTTGEESRPATLSELQLVRDQLNSRMDDLRNELNRRIDDLQKVMFWGFGLLAALLIALMGLVLSGAG